MSEELVTIEINGVPVKARKGSMLIQAADDAGVYIPRFCYHEKLSVAANCRMCLVEVEKAPKPMPACATPVGDGMKVYTNSPKAMAAQKATMEFLLINHPLDCPVCDQGGECELQDLALGYGKDVSRYQERKRAVFDKNIGPLIMTSMTRCIHCTRCVRFGQEVAGIQELGATGRGEHMEIGTYIARSVDHELSGNVIDLCPVGALNSKPFRMHGRGWEMTAMPMIAGHDCIGSNLMAHVLRGKVLRAVPHENEAVNETWISDRDRFSYEGIYSAERLQRPMVKRGGNWQEVEWDVALDAAAQALREVLDADGPEQLGALASCSSTLEEFFLLQKLLRAMGVQNLDHRLQQADFRDDASAPAWPSLGLAIEELEQQDAILMVGGNIRKEAPLFGHRIRKAALRGAEVSFINPRKYDVLFRTAAQITGDPAGELACLVRALEDESGRKADKKIHAAVADSKPGEAHRRVAASLLKADKAVLFLGHLAQRAVDFADLRVLAAAAAQLSGATLGYVTQGANSAGGWLSGFVPHRLPGGTAAREAGLNARSMFEQPRRGYLLLGIEPEHDSAVPAQALAALQAAQSVVVLSPFVSEVMKSYASVLLPVGTAMESSGTFLNGEGRVQSFGGVARPVGEARPAWKVLRVLGNALDVEGFDYMTPEEVREDALAVAGSAERDNRYAGSHVPEQGARGEGLRRITEYSLYAVDPLVRRVLPLQETADARVARCLVLNPDDAVAAGVVEGETAAVCQGEAEIELPVKLDDTLTAGVAVVPGGIELTAGFGEINGAVQVTGRQQGARD